jgi:hypothetical protein
MKPSGAGGEGQVDGGHRHRQGDQESGGDRGEEDGAGQDPLGDDAPEAAVAVGPPQERPAAGSRCPAGIRVTIQREPEENYWTDIWMVKPFTTVSWGGRAPDEALSVVYKSNAEWNESRYNNPRVDELIIKARSQAEPADRRETYREIQRILIDEVPRIIPVFGPEFQGLRLDVRDCEANQKSSLLLYKCWLDD